MTYRFDWSKVLTNETYSKEEVEKIVSIFESELITAIDSAYNEGYKQGLLEVAPDYSFYKTMAEEVQVQNAQLKKQKRFGWWVLPVSFMVGFAGGVITMVILNC